jgi:signal transduction histidine kinase/ligand-binding sensor domain-containing protein
MIEIFIKNNSKKYCVSNVFFYVLILNFVFLSFSLKGQKNIKLNPEKKLSQYILRNWTTEDGLPSNALTGMTQTRDGYIWLSSYDGVVRFDGVKFEHFYPENSPALRSHVARTLLEDRRGRLWVGLQRGVSFFENGAFHTPQELQHLNHYSIETLYADRQNTIWIGTSASGLYTFNEAGLQRLAGLRLYMRGAISDVLEDKEGNIWIASEIGELVKYKNNKFKLVGSPKTTKGIKSLYEDSKGTLWVGGGDRVFCVKDDSIFPYKNLKVREIRQFIEDTQGFFWFANDEGLHRYRLDNQQLESLSPIEGLPSNLIRSLMVDRQGYLWLATFRQGFFQLVDGKFTNYSTAEGLPSNIVTAILQKDSLTYWIATESEQLAVWQNGYISLLHLPALVPKGRTKHLFEDSKKNIWISTDKGVTKIPHQDSSHLSPKTYSVETGFPDDFIQFVFEDSKNRIWIGTQRTGLHLLAGKKTQRVGKKVVLSEIDSLLTFDVDNAIGSDFISSMIESRTGEFVVGSKRGLTFFNQKPEVLRHLTVQEGLPSNIIFTIYEDKEGILWVTTDGGLARIEGKKITAYDTQMGMVENVAFDVLEDRFGYLWLPCSNGIMRVEKKQLNAIAQGKAKTLDCKRYDRSDGMKNNECVGATRALAAHDGTLWFSTFGGITVVNPAALPVNKTPPVVIIEKITTENQAVRISNLLHSFAPTDKRFLFSYTAFDYDDPKTIRFQYKLEPFDADWIAAGRQRTALYTNLPAGTYTFRVRAMNHNGYVSKEESTYTFEVEPRFYETIWFMILMVLLAIFAIWAGYKIRMYHLESRKAELEREVLNRTQEVLIQKQQIEKQKEELLYTVTSLRDAQTQLVQSEKMASLGQLTAGIAHEINNPITFVYAGVDVLQHMIDELMQILNLYETLHQTADASPRANLLQEIQERKAKINYDEIKKDLVLTVEDIRQGAARTAEIVKGLRTFSRLDEADLKMADVHENLEATLVILRPQYKNRVQIEKNYGKLPLIECFPGKLNQVFTNILANAIQAIPDKGKISITTQVIDNQHVCIQIQDTGEGMDEQVRQRIFEPFFTTKEVGKGTGLGLSISFSIIQKHKGTIEVESEKGKGTTFKITLPIQQGGG